MKATQVTHPINKVHTQFVDLQKVVADICLELICQPHSPKDLEAFLQANEAIKMARELVEALYLRVWMLENAHAIQELADSIWMDNNENDKVEL
jgi:hypothetical protein